MKIGIYGSASGDIPEETKKKARQLGREIAKRGHTVITGGCTGLPHEVVLGAKEEGGKTIAFSPGTNIEQHKEVGFPTEGFDEFIFVPKDFEFSDNWRARQKYRNLTCTLTCDKGILIKGMIGTLNEFTCLYDNGKDIGVFTETGGAADMIKGIVETFNKPTKSRIVYESDPAKLIDELEKLE